MLLRNTILALLRRTILALLVSTIMARLGVVGRIVVIASRLPIISLIPRTAAVIGRIGIAVAVTVSRIRIHVVIALTTITIVPVAATVLAMTIATDLLDERLSLAHA